jgi:hypothetical protein
MRQSNQYLLTTICLQTIFFFTFLSTATSWNNLNAQDEKQQKETGKEASFKKMIDSKQFLFVAQSVMPMSGRTRQLTSEYGLTLKKDTLESFLPYFGRAYNAPIGSTDEGIQFKSYKFDYALTETKKGRWEISIQPKDVNDSYRLNLSVSKSGYATLQVTSNSRQPISFQGYITEIRPAKGEK